MHSPNLNKALAEQKTTLNVLLLADPTVHGAATVNDHIDSFQRYSTHNLQVFAMRGDLPRHLDIHKFDAIIIHYSLAIIYEQYVSAAARQQLRAFKGIKALFIQDEYRWVNHTHNAMDEIQFDILFTCVPPSEIEKVYPSTKFPNLTKLNVLTGYVPHDLLGLATPSYRKRPLDVVYRARKLSAWYGRLAQEKWQIVDKFKQDAKRYNLKVDLSYHEHERIYGKKWINFLSSSKAALGVESGASVFDFTGEIQKNVEAHEARDPSVPFEVLEELYFKGLDGAIYLNQISPRCFECAALRTLMILYEGNYSGILKPWQHYVPLKKDHSNIEEVVSILKDEKRWKDITDRAYEEIALNPLYHYQTMVNVCETAIEEKWKDKGCVQSTFYSAEELKSLHDLNKKDLKEREKERWVSWMIYKWWKRIFQFISRITFIPVPQLEAMANSVIKKLVKIKKLIKR